ncbi:transporter substrate-binding domain-containing protein [Shewanella waksmanii]|uniref:transporter substrate-binding domain-containing protein n=1 Tax=Shewanella waksmanii TaxID=213783 RepID=UPI0004BCB989|nr:transporter substrate-binding domain-containing protein [Shewanella waksmanii]
MYRLNHLANPILFYLALLFTALFCAPSLSADNTPLKFGISIGFPPYQYQVDDYPAGFDVDVAKLIANSLERDFEFVQGQWDTVLNQLRFGEIDLIVGMEINSIRARVFDFSAPYYERRDAVFVLSGNQSIKQLADLEGRLVAGDRHSTLQSQWQQQQSLYQYRLQNTASKAVSMQRLDSGLVDAAIMPEAVGLFLAKQRGVKVSILAQPASGTPVAVAVKKGNASLHQEVNQAVQQLLDSGEIPQLYQRWFHRSDN